MPGDPMSSEEVPEELVKELTDSEKRLKALYEKRDHFNEEGKVYREMRDDLHGKRKEVLLNIQKIRDERTKLLEEMKAAKARREMFNEKARTILGIKRRSDGEVKKADPYEDIRTIEIELIKLEDLYQTQSHSIAKEREIVKSIEVYRKKLKEIKAKEPVFQAAKVEAQSKEEEIREYRRLADEEHARVNEIFEKLKELNKKMDEISPVLDHLRKEADKRHEEYLKVRKQADVYHQKAMELREKVISLRQERDQLRRDSRALIDNQNEMVNKELSDKDKLDDAADRAVDMLLRKGKITL
ncbi:MAG: hypothetical protein JXA22_08030 [Candidatus Thermoplasmatota archaeon]|nr:hypothetical protein [Candidatus Thermoplasmatota archaeon]